MNIIVILLLAIVVLALLCVLLFKIVLDRGKENKTLKIRLNRRNDNIRYLLEHARTLGEIRKDSAELTRRIRIAKTDDDIDSVIGDIIRYNNDRVQDA
ncbi:MAG: hypothetical protein ACTTKL_11450 [Treponema sp.]